MSYPRRRIVRILLAAVASVATESLIRQARADGPDISYIGQTYTQNFDSLYNAGYSTNSPWSNDTINDGYNLGTNTVQSWLNNSSTNNMTNGLLGWYANEQLLSGSSFVYYVSDGTVKSKGTLTGGLYDFGSSANLPGTNPQTDRALGVVATSSSGLVTFGAEFINNSSTSFTQLNISYTGEQWMTGSSGITNTLSFNYGIFNNDGSSNLTSNGMTGVSALNFSSLQTNNATIGQALDGNLIANSTTLSDSILNAVWAPGQVLWLTWSMPGKADGPALAIDNLSFTAVVSPARNLTWNPSAGSNLWNANNASNQNWLNNSTAASYSQANLPGDIVNFTDAGVGTVIIDPGGVVPTAVNVTNTSGTYVLAGGSIGGSTSVSKTGAGALVLASANSYTGGTFVDTGTLIISNDNNLGDPSGALSLSTSATLVLTGPVVSTRTINAVSGTVVVDTQGNSVSFGTLNSAGGSFDKVGSGTLTLANVSSFSNQVISVSAGALNLNQTGGNTAFSAAGGNYAGNIILSGATRISINGGSISGGGEILVAASGAAINAFGNATTFLENNVVINPNNATGSFNAHIGATSGSTLQVDGQISGNGDVVVTNSLTNGGAGILLLNNQNTYTGNTVITFGTRGVLRLNVNNALPTTTNLVFGDGVNASNSNLGAFDLDGFNQTLASIATSFNANDTTASATGIVNTGFTRSTLTLTGSANTVYSSIIGDPGPFTGSQLGGIDLTNIALVLDSTFTGSLTMGPASTGSNYSGGTYLNGGTLAVSSDASLGGPSSPLNFNGGTLQINDTSFTSTSHSIVWGANGGNFNIANPANVFTVSTPLTGGPLGVAGAGTLLLTADNAVANTTIAPGATLQIGNGSTSGTLSTGNLTNNGNLVLNRSDISTVTISGALTGNGALSHIGSGTTTLAVTNYQATGPINVAAGRLVLPGGPIAVVASNLTIAGTPTAPTATLDIKDGGLVIPYTDSGVGATLTSTLYAQAVAARGVQDPFTGLSPYNQPGLTSSTAAFNNANINGFDQYGVGVINNADIDSIGIENAYTSFMGQPVGVDTVLIRYTYMGDVDLDGKIDANDVSYLINSFNGFLPGYSGLIAADFDDNGVIDANDVGVLVAGFNFQGSPLDAGGLTPLGSPALDLDAGPNATPEPASLMLLGLGAVGLLRRRKGSRQSAE